MNQNNIVIYSIENYNDLEKFKQYNTKIGNIEFICNILKTENKGYHLKLDKNEKVILFGDVDHVPNENIFNDVLFSLSNFFNIKKEHISFTLSKKKQRIFLSLVI